MKSRLFKGKSKRTKIFTAITALAIPLIIALNLLLYYFGVQKTIFIDMTPEGLYTLSDLMIEECDGIFEKVSQKDGKEKVKVTFCTDPDYLIGSTTARLTYFMALKLQNEYPENIEVETVNVGLNPTAVSQYKATSLSKIKANNVIVSYGGRYRIATLDYFWVNGTAESYYNGEYRIATLMKSVTAISQPKAYFVTDHGETYYDPEDPDSEMSKSMGSFASLLADLGLEIKLIKLSEVERVPDDCALLIINNPTKDFTFDPDRLDELGYVSDTEKLDRYLVTKQGSIAVAKDYQKTLPVFEDFLYEWGFTFSDSIVVDKESSLTDIGNTGTNIIATYDTDPDSFGYAIYGEYASLSSAPITIVSNAGSIGCSFNESSASGEPGVAGNVSRNYVSYLTTSGMAQRYMRDPVTGEITSIVDGKPGKYDLAALSVRNELNETENVRSYSYIFCVNSPDFFSNKLLGESSYANYDIVSAVINNIARVDEHASMHLGGTSYNSAQIGGKLIIPMDMSTTSVMLNSNRYDSSGKLIVIKKNHGISSTAKVIYTCAVAVAPVAIAALGIVTCVKRRHL